MIIDEIGPKPPKRGPDFHGTIARTSSRNEAGDGMSSRSPQTSAISSTDVAGSRSSWNDVSSFDDDLSSASSLCRIQSAKADDHSEALALLELKENNLAFPKWFGVTNKNKTFIKKQKVLF